MDDNGTLTLLNEVLAPDSSRYWPIEGCEAAFAAGLNPPSYDKQFVRAGWKPCASTASPGTKPHPPRACPMR